MAYPRIKLGGVEIVLHAGAPEESAEPIGGEVLLRLSLGAGVKMQHWTKASGTISSQGWMPPGLDGLDYSQPLELRSTQVENIVGTGLVHTLTSTPRPDYAPWGQAMLNGHWVRTTCTVLDGVATVGPVAGATLYQVCWMPVYSVFARKPSKAQSSIHGWSIAWEEK